VGFRRFGAAEVLSVHVGVEQAAAHVRKQAHRAVFSYMPREGYVYVRSRAISSRCNDNFDMFPAEEIEKSYRSFIGKPVFVNHHNSDHKQMRGMVIDAALHKDRNPDGSPDTWAEVLMEVDALTYPKLAVALINGDIDRTSMGCDVQISKCSICQHVARNPLEYCRHIPGMKGKRIFQAQPDGRKLGKLVYETCYGLSFFENSLLVEPPADPTALRLGNVDIGPGLDHIVSRAARLREAAEEHNQPLQRTASRRTASFLDDYPSDDEITQMRNGTHPNNQGGFGGNREPWRPYRHELESRPEPRVAELPHIKSGPSSREHGTTYLPAKPGEKGAFPAPSPSEEYHGPYEVIRHAQTGKYHVVDNSGRATRYGGDDGVDDRFYAEHARDYAEHRQSGKERARAMADSMYSGTMNILDPGGTPESRESERNSHAMNSLLDHGYQPQQIKFDEDESPYGEVHHPSGWTARDYGGHGYLHIHHPATGDEAHDAIQLSESDENGRDYRKPAYGPTEALQDLSAWHDDHESGTREHYEQNDPRIRRWRMRHGAALHTGVAGEDVHNFTVHAVDRRTGGEIGTMLREPLCADHRAQLQAQLDQHNASQHPHEYRAVTAFPQRANVGCSACTIREVNDAFGEHNAAAKEPAPKKANSKGDRFFETNKVDPAHIINAFNNAKPAQKAEGMDWYQHIHRTAQMITGGKLDSKHHQVIGGDPAKGAGLLAVYSGQSGLSDNHWKASKVSLEGRGLGGSVGNGDPHAVRGFFADKTQAEKAQRILNGEHHSQVLGLGSPKTANFAHLIEHGGDDGSGHSAVCVDRHALSVALGRRVTDKDFGDSELSKPPNVADRKQGYTENHRYRMVSDAYRHAASELSKQHKIPIAPHQVQAVTWVVQRDMNNDVDAKSDDPKMQRLIKGRATNNKNAQARWFAHVKAHYPEFADQPHWKMTMLQHQGYNEMLAPEKVDTLRDEQCPICGNDIAFDGRECAVCGYIQPPKPLNDPDVDKAKQLDQLRENVEDTRDQSGLDPSQPGADFEAGDTDQAMPGGDNSNSPWLECNNCGTGLRPSAPQTSPTDPAQGPTGPTEGDTCPVCEKGVLSSTGESEDDTDEQAIEGEEPEQDELAPEDEQDEDEEVPDEDEDDEPKKSKKNPAGKATAAMKYRDHSKEYPMGKQGMQHGLASLAKQNEQLELQARQIQWLRTKLAVRSSQVQRLTAGLAVLARAAGPQIDAQVRTAMLTKQADEQNPAQPVPEPNPQPPSQSTVQAETPEAFADVTMPGMVPGVNQDVAADAVTTAYTPGQDIAAPPFKQLVDVTAPIEGTQGPRPTSEVKTNVDVRAGNPMNPQVAFPLGGPFANAQRTGAAQGDDLRTMASIRLARLRIAANIESGEDLVIGHRIASDQTMSMERIQQEIATLNSVRTAAAANAQAPLPPRSAVPRPAAPPQRIVPPLAPANGGFQATAGYRQQEDDELAAALSG
jgi:hypothetical protein